MIWRSKSSRPLHRRLPQRTTITIIVVVVVSSSSPESTRRQEWWGKSSHRPPPSCCKVIALLIKIEVTTVVPVKITFVKKNNSFLAFWRWDKTALSYLFFTIIICSCSKLKQLPVSLIVSWHQTTTTTTTTTTVVKNVPGRLITPSGACVAICCWRRWRRVARTTEETTVGSKNTCVGVYWRGTTSTGTCWFLEDPPTPGTASVTRPVNHNPIKHHTSQEHPTPPSPCVGLFLPSHGVVARPHKYHGISFQFNRQPGNGEGSSNMAWLGIGAKKRKKAKLCQLSGYINKTGQGAYQNHTYNTIWPSYCAGIF